MQKKQGRTSETKSDFHKRSKHRERYDFDKLIASNPKLKAYVTKNKFGDDSIDFFDSKAVYALNQSLLMHHYNMEYWEIPNGYLCPPIPGRADYIHHMADLLGEENDGVIPTGNQVSILDIGVGANGIYPIIGNAEYEWSFVGSDIDSSAIKSVKEIADGNRSLKDNLEIRYQENIENIFAGIINPGDHFSVSICNPPFHASREEAIAVNKRKLNNLLKKRVKNPNTNFGGKDHELWYDGGEREFILKMIKESKNFSHQIDWFSSLVSKESNVDFLYDTVDDLKPKDLRIIPMKQGNKISRIIAWRF